MIRLHQLFFLICIATIFSIGLVMIFNTTSAEIIDLERPHGTHQALIKQGLYAIGGILMALLVYRIGYNKLLEWSPYLLIFFCFLLVLTLIPGVGKEVNGSRRWIGIAGFSFQPSEFVKLVAPAYFIYRLRNIEGALFSLKEFLKLVATVLIPIALIVVEPNNGTAGVILLTILVLCILNSIRFKYWAMPLIILIVVGGFSAYNLAYVSARIKVYLHPELDLKGKGHQPYQAKIAAGSGKLWGRGPGNSLQKLSYLPEAQNDYIAAIYAEEFGFIGVLVLIILYMCTGYAGFFLAQHCTDKGAFCLASTITFLICFQAFMNLGVVSGLLPSTGLNLPFFSQGGTSLMANITSIGILLNISSSQQESIYV